MKKTICVILAAFLISIASVSAENSRISVPVMTESMYTGGFMKPEAHCIGTAEATGAALFSRAPEKPFEDYLFEQTMKINKEIDVSEYGLNADEFSKAFEEAVFSNGYMPIITRYSYVKQCDTVITVLPEYVFNTESEALSAYERLSATVDSIYEYASAGKTDLEKILFTYQKLVLDFNYDPNPIYVDAEGNKSYKNISYTPYGFTENNGYAVCQGYSLLFGMVLDKFGIENAFCSSDEVNHIWNYIKINENRYHSDSTWGELTNQDGTPAEGYVSFRYFLRSDSLEGHGIKNNWQVYGLDKLPDCLSAEYESGYIFSNNQFPVYRSGDKLYFNVNNRFFTSKEIKNNGPFFSIPYFTEDKTDYQFSLFSLTDNGDATVLVGIFTGGTNLDKLYYIPVEINSYTLLRLPSVSGVLQHPGRTIKYMLTGSDMIAPLAEYAKIETSDLN